MQFSSYYVSVENGSNIVAAATPDLVFTGKIMAGNAFTVKGDPTIYQIASVSADQFTLTVPYAGPTNAAAKYQVTTDYTPNFGLVEINTGDQDWPKHLTHGVIRKLDETLAAHMEPVEMPMIKTSAEGGILVRMINATGAGSVKGTVVVVSPTVDNAVSKLTVDVMTPIGVIYEDGIPDGDYVWVAVSGITKVLFVGDTTRGKMARGFTSSDPGYVSGSALCDVSIISPYDLEKHFFEIGMVTESRVGAGLANVLLHFN